MWDTEHNSGVLIYLLLADREVEIVADRGIARQVAAPEWEAICREMEAALRNRRFERAVLGGIASVGALLADRFPAQGEPRNELPDRPAVI